MNQAVQIPDKWYRWLYLLMGIGLVTFVAGLFFAQTRIWPNFLIAEFYLLGLGLGAGFIIAVQYTSNAAWGTAYRRIPEAVTALLPWGLAGILVLIFGIHTLYEWSHESVVAHDPLLQKKSVYLNVPFFVGRLLFYIAGWVFLSRRIAYHSQRQDRDGLIKHTHINVKYSSALLVFGVITFIFASFDLLMSLQPHWYSTVFGLITLSGMFLNALAIVTLLAVTLRWLGFQEIITRDHLHDLGKLVMAMSAFWVYMWISQHLLIWYSNIPEETSYYVFRHFGGWGSLSFLNLVLNWFVPFVVLLPKATKRNDKIMFQVSLILVIGHWLDLYILVMPGIFGTQPTLGLWELGMFAGMLGLIFRVIFRKLETREFVPVNDPYLVESLPGRVYERVVGEGS